MLRVAVYVVQTAALFVCALMAQDLRLLRRVECFDHIVAAGANWVRLRNLPAKVLLRNRPHSHVNAILDSVALERVILIVVNMGSLQSLPFSLLGKVHMRVSPKTLSKHLETILTVSERLRPCSFSPRGHCRPSGAPCSFRA